MKLYHNGMSVCAQKVRLVLAAKGLPYDSVILDLQNGDQFSPEYEKLNPGRVVPTLEDHGHIFCESSLINEYLEDAYPDHPLRPQSAEACYRMRFLAKMVDDRLHQSCGVISYAIALRTLILDKPAAEIEAMTSLIPDPLRRHNRSLVIRDGILALPFAPALATYLGVLQQADKSLQSYTWCAGDSFSLADCAILPYVLRLDHLQLLDLLGDMPSLRDWYDRVRALPFYAAAITEYLPEKAVALFARCGQDVRDDVIAIHTR